MMPGNPVVGGTVLRRPAVQSPNFAHASTGWSINADGSAEFNNLTIRGTFDGTNFILATTGFFLYSGTPALGNLIASIAPTSTSTDPEGNTVKGGGFTSYDASGNTGQLVTAFLSLMASGANTPGLVNMQAPGWIAMQSGNAVSSDSEATVSAQSRGANSGTSLIALSADAVQITGTLTAQNTTVPGTLTVGGSTSTQTAGLTDGTIAGTSSNAGLTNGQIAGTSGGASAGTAHTHGPGSFAVTNGQHSHASGSYAVNNGTHQHAF